MMKYTWLKVCESNSWCNNCIFGSRSKKSAVVSSILWFSWPYHLDNITRTPIANENPIHSRRFNHIAVIHKAQNKADLVHILLWLIMVIPYDTTRLVLNFWLWFSSSVIARTDFWNISAGVFEMAQPCWKVYNLCMNCLEGQAQLNIVGKKYHRTISG